MKKLILMTEATIKPKQFITQKDIDQKEHHSFHLRHMEND
jgi:hypothetical protein